MTLALENDGAGFLIILLVDNPWVRLILGGLGVLAGLASFPTVGARLILTLYLALASGRALTALVRSILRILKGNPIAAHLVLILDQQVFRVLVNLDDLCIEEFLELLEALGQLLGHD